MNKWQTKKLGEVCGVVNGGTPKTNVIKYWDGNILWMTPKDMGKIQDIYTNNTSRKITKQGLKNSSAKLIPKNSVILSTRAPIGHLVINSEEMSFNQGCKGLVTGDSLDNKYLFYFLFTSVDLLNKLGSGTTFKELSSTKLKQIQIPLPPISEQRRIVKILDEAFNKIKKSKENTEKNLKNSRELFESYLQSIFSSPDKNWENKMLEEICDVIAGQSPEGKYYNKIGNGLPFYQGKKKFTDKFIDPPTTWTTDVTKEALKDDILMSVRAPVGPINFATQRICIGRGLAAIRAGKKIDVNFLFYFLKYFESKIIGNHGAVFNSINKKQIEEIKVPLPLLPEQKAIVKKLDELSAQTKKLEEIYLHKLDNLEELKKSILKTAFDGKLITKIFISINIIFSFWSGG